MGLTTLVNVVVLFLAAFCVPSNVALASTLVAVERPWFNSNLGALSCFGPSWKPEVLRTGWRGFGEGLLPGLGSGVKSPSGVPQLPRVLMLLMTSPAIGNPACTVQVCHFTHFRHACKSNSSVAGLDHHRPTSAKAEHEPIANCNIILFTVNYTYQ